jgi:hypothetical protein
MNQIVRKDIVAAEGDIEIQMPEESIHGIGEDDH